MNRVLVTGGAGFIGSAVIRQFVALPDYGVLNVDCLTYAGNLASLSCISDSPRYRFARVDVTDLAAIEALLAEFQPHAVLHLAAESHVDRSIDSAAPFIQTNVVGTHAMLEASTAYWQGLAGNARDSFRFHHVSTDEVYGSLGSSGRFTETTPYRPTSPYSASKAASDHLVRAWHLTHGLPVIVTNCSNNYGPYQFPEKLMPLTIINALSGGRLPVYGQGDNVRDWLFVDDHVEALRIVLENGVPGETYNIGGNAERRNIDVVRSICAVLDEVLPDSPHRPHDGLVEFVADRPGHDLRYAIDTTKVESQLGWTARESFDSGVRKTVLWYLENRDWWQPILDGTYQGQRLGLKSASQ